MTSPRRWVLLVSLLAACERQIVNDSLTPDETLTVLRYLDCIDCGIFLDSLRALASRKPQPTVDSLNSGLLSGPGPQALSVADSALAIGYQRDQAWRANHGLMPLPDSTSYVTAARKRYVDGYRSRGAIGMGFIHTPRAVAHLDSAMTLPLPASVMRSVKYARDSLPPR
jgi:hypothetical protein